MENNENNTKESCICNKNEEPKKLLIIALMTFVGSFLAFYVLMHQTMIYLHKSKHHLPIISEKSVNEMEREIQNSFKKFENRELNKFKSKISAIQTLKYEDAYIIIINLKPFNNNEDNIRFSINGNVATVSGNVVKNKHNSENAYYFTESFEIPEKIKINEIEKEKVDGKYIIVLPIEN